MCHRPIAEELVEALDEVCAKWPGRKVSVVVVGHSLPVGGALAVLNSMVLAASPMVHRVTTFTEGCPMILTDDAVKHLQGLRQEAVINKMPVPQKVPVYATGTQAGWQDAGGASEALPLSLARPIARLTMLNVAHCQVCASTSCCAVCTST